MAKATVKERNWIFYYDRECGFCTLSVRLLALADLFRQVRWVAFQDLAAPPIGLSWEDLAAAAYLEVRSGPKAAGDDARKGKLYRGFYAVRMLALVLPPLWPLTPLLWLPGAAHVGTRFYGWVAANRYRISRRCRLRAGK